MRRERLYPSGKQLRLLRGIVHAVDHRIFKRYAPSGFVIIGFAFAEKLVHAAAAVGRHNAASRFVVRRVQRYGERDLEIALCQIVEALRQPAGGERYMTHADVASLRVVDELQKPHDGIKIIQRFANAHQNDVRNRQTGFLFGKQHLVKHFRGRKIPYKPADGRSAERASLPAADLRGDADRIPVVIPHDDRFHGVSVLKLPEKFDRPVLGGLLFPEHARRGERTALG